MFHGVLIKRCLIWLNPFKFLKRCQDTSLKTCFEMYQIGQIFIMYKQIRWASTKPYVSWILDYIIRSTYVFRSVFDLKYWTLSLGTPPPRPLIMGTFDTKATIDPVGSGDMSSMQYNRIWSSANSFFRDMRYRHVFWTLTT